MSGQWTKATQRQWTLLESYISLYTQCRRRFLGKQAGTSRLFNLDVYFPSTSPLPPRALLIWISLATSSPSIVISMVITIGLNNFIGWVSVSTFGCFYCLCFLYIRSAKDSGVREYLAPRGFVTYPLEPPHWIASIRPIDDHGEVFCFCSGGICWAIFPLQQSMP